jgi:hypothetical protein
MTDLFNPDGKNLNQPSWAVGGADVRETHTSYSVGKGGDFDQYKHFFQWERMKDPSKTDEAVGFFAWNNFNCSPEDEEFGRTFREMYENVRRNLGIMKLSYPSEANTMQSSQIEPNDTTILPQGRQVVRDAGLYFKGDLGLFAYKQHEFLYWAGVAFRVQVHDGKEYIFTKGRPPMPIKVFDSDDGCMHYIQVGGAQATQIRQDAVLEAAKSKKSEVDLTDALELLPQLLGTYRGDHRPPSDFSFVQNSSGEILLLPPADSHSLVDPPVPLQLLHVQRGKSSGEIQELHMTWCDDPPDKMLKFIREEGGKWNLQVTGFLTGALYETCTKV